MVVCSLAISDPRIMHMVSAVAIFGALTAGLIGSLMGRGSRRCLVPAATLTGMNAALAGIKWLLQ